MRGQCHGNCIAQCKRWRFSDVSVRAVRNLHSDAALHASSVIHAQPCHKAVELMQRFHPHPHTTYTSLADSKCPQVLSCNKCLFPFGQVLLQGRKHRNWPFSNWILMILSRTCVSTMPRADAQTHSSSAGEFVFFCRKDAVEFCPRACRAILSWVNPVRLSYPQHLLELCESVCDLQDWGRRPFPSQPVPGLSRPAVRDGIFLRGSAM